MASTSLDRQIYCPGESIAIHAKFSNICSFAVRPTASLVQIQTFRADRETPAKVVEVVIGCTSEVETPQRIVESGRDGVWEPPALLKIPVVCPSVQNCDLMQVNYEVRVRK